MRKKYRIRKNEEFQDILKRKQFITSPSFTLYYADKQEENSRIGISVGKKLGHAVERNKIKRQVRMMCQEISAFKESFDCVIMVRNRYQENTYLDNKHHLIQCFERCRAKYK